MELNVVHKSIRVGNLVADGTHPSVCLLRPKRVWLVLSLFYWSELRENLGAALVGFGQI